MPAHRQDAKYRYVESKGNESEEEPSALTAGAVETAAGADL